MTANKKRKDIKAFLLSQKRICEITTLITRLSSIPEILWAIERGAYKDNNGKQTAIKCLRTERDIPTDKGFISATYLVFGCRVEMLFAVKQFLYIRSVCLQQTVSKELSFSQKELQEMFLFSILNWQPSNELFWINMALVREMEQNSSEQR